VFKRQFCSGEGKESVMRQQILKDPVAASELLAKGHQPEPVLKAIRRKCLECSGGSAAEVAGCMVSTCALYPFRMGKNPWRAEVSEARRDAARKAAANINKPRTIPSSGATDSVSAPFLPERLKAA
jgi:hypothetical protein